MNTNNGGPAFPEPGLSGLPDGHFIYGQSGMTMRDYFAAKAMQGFASTGGGWRDGINGMARCAYECADAMLAAREPAAPETTWQQRVVAEKSELDEKLEKLRAFLSKAPPIAAEAEALLTEQAQAMQAYSDVLAKRLAAFGSAE